MSEGPIGNVCMYVCMYVSTLAPAVEVMLNTS